MSWLPRDIEARVVEAVGLPVVSARPLPAGSVADVFRVYLDDDSTVVVKLARKGGLAIEGFMLRYLQSQSPLPVPGLFSAAEDLLVMEDMGGGGRLTATSEVEAAEHVAALHGVTAEAFGLSRDTMIGPLHQPNPPTRSWVEFFREHRLLYMGRIAHERGGLSPRGHAMLRGLCAKLERYIPEPERSSLIHGDLWGGNVIVEDDRVTGFIDPAIYFADPEIELAFGMLFNTFGEAFFKRYAELAPLRPGFFETRRDIYQLYPLLVHTAIFGRGYGQYVEASLERYV
jgi:fructosamine-3-kinase